MDKNTNAIETVNWKFHCHLFLIDHQNFVQYAIENAPTITNNINILDTQKNTPGKDILLLYIIIIIIIAIIINIIINSPPLNLSNYWK